ncbi:MAG: site-specific integrase [Desulfovibrionales bacterium]|nr:MAG: site-specific integrase [Desulfovibrionales bacterium]
MAKVERHKTRYPGVFFVWVERRPGPGQEKSFIVTFWKDGRLNEVRVGKQSEGMSDKQAQIERNKYMTGERLTKAEAKAKAAEEAEAARLALEQERNRPTLSFLWEKYQEQKSEIKSNAQDRSRWNKYLAPAFADRTPQELVTLDLDRLRLKLKKQGHSPQTVKHVLALFRRIVRFAVLRGLCPPVDPQRLHLEMPEVKNLKTEYLDRPEVDRLLSAMERCEDWRPVAVLKIAMLTGMRRGEILKLQWRDLDLERGFVTIRAPKGGDPATLPLSEAALTVFKSIPRHETNCHLFPAKDGPGHLADMNRPLRKLKQTANLPADFRVCHGLRHHFASTLASKGVSLHVVQKLLNHSDPKMTMRYAHLQDEALRNGATAMADDLNRPGKVIPLDKGCQTQGGTE